MTCLFPDVKRCISCQSSHLTPCSFPRQAVLTNNGGKLKQNNIAQQVIDSLVIYSWSRCPLRPYSQNSQCVPHSILEQFWLTANGMHFLFQTFKFNYFEHCKIHPTVAQVRLHLKYWLLLGLFLTCSHANLASFWAPLWSPCRPAALLLFCTWTHEK